MSEAKKHCVVIGAGIVGSACAWHLLKDGHAVTVIDPELPGQSTSFGNAGCISPSAVIPFSYPGIAMQAPRWLFDPKGPLFIRWTQLHRTLPWLWRFWRSGSMDQVEAIAEEQSRLMAEVRSEYDRILAETNSEWLRHKRGLIMIYDEKAHYQRDAWQFDLRRKLGQDIRRLSHGELLELEPALQDDPRAEQRIALLDPYWEHLADPAEVTRNIAEAAFAAGAEWKQDRVVALRPSGEGARVETESGEAMDAGAVIVAAGVWSGKLLAPLGIHLPLAAKRGYHTMVHEPSAEFSRPVMSCSRMFMFTPMRLGLRLAGTAEFAAIDAPPNYKRARVLLDHARSYVPGLEGQSYSEWMGQRPVMPDSKAVIGPAPGLPGIWCAFGHGHYGLTQGPATGRIIADLIAERTPPLDLAPFAADRF